MTPETITAIGTIIVALMGIGGCCAAILTPLGAVVGILGKQWLDARKADSDVRQSEINLLKTNIEESRKRYQEEIEVTRRRCAEDRLADRLEAQTCKEESEKLEKRIRELVEDLNGERQENYRIRALAFKAGFEIPDERRKSDFTGPIEQTESGG